MIGAHLSKMRDPSKQRNIALSLNLEVFQTHIHQPQSLQIPNWVLDLADGIEVQDDKPMWVYHAAYTCNLSPEGETRRGTASYLKKALYLAKKYNVRTIVCHVGRTKDLSADDVCKRVLSFLTEYEILDHFKDSGIGLAYEPGANLSDFNRNPTRLLDLTISPTLGWCLDLAHAYAVGIEYDDLWQMVIEHVPTVVHCNFPGSPFGSGKDAHGLRGDPFLVKVNKTVGSRTEEDTESLIKSYDTIVKELYTLEVPLIVEGSSFTTISTLEEVGFLRVLMGDKKAIERHKDTRSYWERL